MDVYKFHEYISPEKRKCDQIFYSDQHNLQFKDIKWLQSNNQREMVECKFVQWILLTNETQNIFLSEVFHKNTKNSGRNFYSYYFCQISRMKTFNSFNLELYFSQLLSSKTNCNYLARLQHMQEAEFIFALLQFALADIVCLSTTKHQAIRKRNNSKEETTGDKNYFRL